MQLIEKYIAAWNETDAQARAKLVADVFTADATYTDPLAAVTGHEQIDGLLGAVQGQFPGLEFRLAGPVDAHHDVCRFTWHLAPADGEAIVVGFDVAVLDGDRIASVAGFLDKVPA